MIDPTPKITTYVARAVAAGLTRREALARLREVLEAEERALRRVRCEVAGCRYDAVADLDGWRCSGHLLAWRPVQVRPESAGDAVEEKPAGDAGAAASWRQSLAEAAEWPCDSDVLGREGRPR